MGALQTSSNHIIDLSVHSEDRFRLFRLDRSTSTTQVHAIQQNNLKLLNELGVRPSSAAQSNCVIWVEGPSDAIYLRFWLRRHEQDLVEGRDFTFAFSAGSLLQHFDIERTEESLAVFLEIHPNFFVVADSDRRSATSTLRPALAKLTESIGHRVWVTLGRTIEAYIPTEAFAAEFGTSQATRLDPYLSVKERLKRVMAPKSLAERKVQLANQLVSAMNDLRDSVVLEVLDLRTRLAALGSYIRRCSSSLQPTWAEDS